MATGERKWRRRTTAQWRELLDRHVHSGQSVEAFCQTQAISTASFYRWRKQLLGGDETVAGVEQQSPAPLPTFVDLGSLGGSRSGWELELALGGGVVLRLRGG